MDWLTLIERFGYPITMSIYMAYLTQAILKRQSAATTTELQELKKAVTNIRTVLVDLAIQNSMMISSLYMHKETGDGDRMAIEAIKVGERIKERESQ